MDAVGLGPMGGGPTGAIVACVGGPFTKPPSLVGGGRGCDGK